MRTLFVVPGLGRSNGQSVAPSSSVADLLSLSLSRWDHPYWAGLDYLVVYLEGGDYIRPDATETVERLGKKLYEGIKEAHKRFRHLEEPNFAGALSPLADFWTLSLIWHLTTESCSFLTSLMNSLSSYISAVALVMHSLRRCEA